MKKERNQGSSIPLSPPDDSACKRYQELMKKKPSVPGKATSFQFIPAGGYWGGVVKRGQVLRVIDLDGQQCFDVIMYDAYDFYNRINCIYTITKEKKWDNWKPGDGIWSRRMDKLAMITEDTSEGHHAYVGAFCTEAWNRIVHGFPNMHSCHDNLVSAMHMAGYPKFSAEDIDWGSCISVFMYFIFKQDGTVGSVPVSNRPGDYIDYMAERDIIVTISNCPGDNAPLNGWECTSIYALVFDPNKKYITKANKLRRAKDTEYKQRLGCSEDHYRTHILRG